MICLVAVIPTASVLSLIVAVTCTRGLSHDCRYTVLCPHEELLLFTYDHSSATDPHPSYQRLGLETKLVYDVQADQSARAPQSSPAMHSHGLTFARVTLGQRNEFANNAVFRARSVWKLHLVHLDRVAREARSVVQFVVEPDDTLDVHVNKVVNQVVWSDVSAHSGAPCISRVLRRRKGDDLLRNDPAQVAMSQHLLKLKAIKRGL